MGKFKVVYETYFFFDFITYLNNDLSYADLLSCDGLVNIKSCEGINFENARITSTVCKALGLSYESCVIHAPQKVSFDFSEQNEARTGLVPRDINNTNEISSDYKRNEIKRIRYISDLHLFYLLKNAKAESLSDVRYVLRSVAEMIDNESEFGDIILIDGDTSFNHGVFKTFVQELRWILHCNNKSVKIVFVLGNHEFWNFNNNTMEEIVNQYKTYLAQYGMYLLHNNVLFSSDSIITNFGYYYKLDEIDSEELNTLKPLELRERIREARIVLFGGTGFAGYNQDYNANYGLYGGTIDSNTEIKETKKFESLYNKVCSVFYDKRVIVASHMPMKDWYKPATEKNKAFQEIYQKGFIYISGHTHHNVYYGDGETEIYSDNQFGYNKTNPEARPHLKCFEVDNTFDYFCDYKDGIYSISAEDYRTFYQGINIHMDFNREINVLYMLKKNGYYCFIHEAKNHKLSILYGGSRKRLQKKDVNYYYEHMDSVIEKIKNPIEQFSAYQKDISAEVKKLGGSGNIHGCIIDIDFMNHIFVNPYDKTITYYYATDTFYKVVFPSFYAILQDNCPSLYATYKNLSKEEKKKELPMLCKKRCNNKSGQSQLYLDTNIYKVSNEIRKIQRIQSKILAEWLEMEFEYELYE